MQKPSTQWFQISIALKEHFSEMTEAEEKCEKVVHTKPILEVIIYRRRARQREFHRRKKNLCQSILCAYRTTASGHETFREALPEKASRIFKTIIYLQKMSGGQVFQMCKTY